MLSLVEKKRRMPKPKSKKELTELSQKNYKFLMDLVASYPKEELNKEFPQGTLNRNIKDVLAHLHQWHLMFLNWYDVGMKGEKPDMPAKGYTWQTMPALNRKIWEDYQTTSLKDASKLLNASYKKVQSIMTNHTDKELFEMEKYKWTGSTSLGVYLISNTSSHYNWAIKLIKKSMM